MNRYLVFAGKDYYPAGGWEDFQVDYIDERLAIKYENKVISSGVFDWVQVVDTSNNNKKYFYRG